MSRKSKKRPAPAAVPTPRKPAPPSPAPAGNAGWIAARALLTLALIISAYLTWVSFSHGSAIGCGPESDCDRVLGSRWAKWLGVPVSAFAVLIDALTLWGTFQIGRAASPERSARGWLAAMLGSILILGAAVWFVALQAFAVGWCPYCMTAHASGAVAAVYVLVQARRSGALPAGIAGRAAGFGAVCLALLVAGQVIYRPKTGRELKDFAVGTNLILTVNPAAQTSGAPSSSASLPRGGIITSSPPVLPTPPPPATNASTTGPAQVFTPGRVPVSAMKQPFKFHDGTAAVDLFDVPVIGSPTNAKAMLSLFDYTCHHCREMHPLLEEVQRAFSNQLVIASLPMPLDATCNRAVTRTSRAHTNACDYARLGLIVWRANRERHHEFNQFLMTGREAPPLSAATARAMQLVGTNAFSRASLDPWAEERLQFSLALYEAAYVKGHGRMPQFIVGRTIAVGLYPRDGLFKLVEENLELKRTP